MSELATHSQVSVARLRRLPAWVLAAGLLMTAVLGAWSFQREAAQRRDLLGREAREAAQALQRQVQALVDTLPGLRVFGLVSRVPSDSDFANYVESISQRAGFPGLVLSFLAEAVPPGGLQAFEARVRADRSVDPQGHPEFRVLPAGDRPGYMVLRHLHPADPSAFGYDLYDPARSYRTEVQAAVDLGRHVATPPLRLARDRDQPDAPERTGVVVRTAFYGTGRIPDTLAERRAQVLGVAGIAFRTQPLADSVLLPRLRQDLRLRLLDTALADGDPAALLYDSLAGRASEAGPPLWTGRIEVADRQWALQAYQRGAWAGQLAGQESTWILLIFGTSLSLALAGLTRGLARANLAAQARLGEAADELRREGEHLRLSEARFRMLFENSFDAVLRTRPSGQVLAANAAACRLFGGSEAQLQTLSRERLVDASDERLPGLLAERQRSGHAAGPLRMRRVDGSCFEAELSSNIYFDQDGQATSSMIVRDVTERQRLAQRLQDKQRMESIGTLAGGVAHDFNNMLAGILGNLALAEAATAGDAAVRQHLQLARRAAERARSLVRQILTFSRRAPQVQRVQALQPLVQEAVSLLRVTMPPTVPLQLQMAAQALHARVDGAQMQQLVLNLCTNAWQALAGQAGEVRISLRPVSLEANEAQALGLAVGDYACLQVEDDGQGMDAATHARIFEPFFTTKPLGEGTGLGLAVVHGVVTDSGGAIRVDSAPGRGARFSVFLPSVPPARSDDADAVVGADPGASAGGDDDRESAAAADAADAADAAGLSPATPSPRASLAGRHVLYVDDDEVVALTARALLAHAGLDVTCCSSGEQALALLQAPGSQFDVLATDFNMPGMSGLDLVQAARLRTPGLGVVVISGLIDDALQARMRQAGLGEVVPKEELLERLVESVRRALPAG